MLKNTEVVSRVFACLLIPGSITFAFAGDVKLVSDNWDSICRVEITSGPQAPNGTPIESHTDVPKNWSITKPDRLCYRRASAPDNCDSGMTQWNTQWICAAIPKSPSLRGTHQCALGTTPHAAHSPHGVDQCRP